MTGGLRQRYQVADADGSGPPGGVPGGARVGPGREQAVPPADPQALHDLNT
jgi:hypothetical protein